MHLRDRWQGWTTVRATTTGVASNGPTAIVAEVAQAAVRPRAGGDPHGLGHDARLTTTSTGTHWFQPGDGRRNVRYRAEGASRWTWVPNGAWSQVITGLRSNTTYKVQARVLADDGWQKWVTATATTD